VTFLKPPKTPGHHGLLHRLEAPPTAAAVAWALRARAAPARGPSRCSSRWPRWRPGSGPTSSRASTRATSYVAIRRIPSIGITEARRLDLETERVLRRFPEVVTSLATTGRAEVATDPVGMDNTDILVHLRPRAEWTTAHDLDALGEAMFKSAIERRCRRPSCRSRSPSKTAPTR
jgi:hypothetical protein